MSKKNQKTKALPAEAFYYKYAHWIFIAVGLICYLPVLNLGLTQLDDTVFINDKHDFISNISNIGKAFAQGCFNEKDIYYRPLLVVYFMLLYPFTSKTSITAYHFGSVALHIINVFLVYALLTKLIKDKKHSFWLTIVFAVHPAFTMAVAWIPGINDLLLTVFALLYFISLLNFAERNTVKDALLSAVYLFGALFTKETGAFVPIGGLLLLAYAKKPAIPAKSYLPLIALNAACWLLWFVARKNVLPAESPSLIDGEMAGQLLHRAAGLLHYFGKCILPFNLTVFPTIESTSSVWGLAAVVLLGVLIFMNKKLQIVKALIGMGWFVLFLLPIFFVPVTISSQLYEHRLYLPMIGILLLLYETILFAPQTTAKTVRLVAGAYFVISIGIIYTYTPLFNDTFSFWNAAVAASPQSAYANKLLGIKYYENNKEKEALPYIKKAYELDSNERYSRLFLARMIYIPAQQWDTARWYLEREIAINPVFGETYAELAHVCVEQKDYACAEKNILKFLDINPRDQPINTNLLLIYNDQGKYAEALKHADKMRAMGMAVDDGLYKAILERAH